MRIEENAPLGPLTTFRAGGKARYLCAASSVSDLREARAFAIERGLPVFVLGGGSNVLVSDAGYPGLVIRNEIRGMRGFDRGDAVVMEAGAGEPWDGFVEACVEKGLWGVENLSLIPGTVGAVPVQNVGAYGVEAKDVVASVKAFDMATGEEVEMSNADCLFAYRDSVFKRPESKRLVITAVSFLLSLSPRPNLSYKDLKDRFAVATAQPTAREVREAVISIRTGKFPDLSELGTAGSFWKNPVISSSEYEGLKGRYPDMPHYPAGEGRVKVPLAWVLDNVCGLKGHRKGRVRLFERQPLVLAAEFGATQAEIDSFAREVEERVMRDTGIRIDREVESIG